MFSEGILDDNLALGLVVDEFGVRAWCTAAAQGADAKNGTDIVILGVGNLLSITDAFVIVTGTSARQVRTIAEEVEAQVRAVGGPPPLRVEGLDDARWVLMDYGDFVVHIFIEEAREFYDLERLWGDAERWVWTPPARVAARQPMPEPLSPSTGWVVLHLFCKVTENVDSALLTAAIKSAEATEDVQVVTASLLGHKADLAIMALGPDIWRLRRLQSEVAASGLAIVESYVSLTEVSEYAKGMPEAMLQTRLYPTLPPEGKAAFCFYPMSKRRVAGANWFEEPYDERERLMRAHGATGRTFAGRVVQLITGSTGLDDYEWGVTLFAVAPDDLKEVVYKMRFDEASARYAEFGPFYVGAVAPLDEVLASVGLAG